MRAKIYQSIGDIGPDRLATLPTGLDFSFGLLQAMERSLWGDLLVRYICIEADDDATLLGFTPVYVGSNLNFNALLPKFIQSAYYALVDGLGTTMATRVALAGSLISDRGWIPMRADLIDGKAAVRLVMEALDLLAAEHHAQLGMVKDIHCNFPAEGRDAMREAGFGQGFSLPTIRIDTACASFEEYVETRLTKNGRKHARKQFRKAEGLYKIRVEEDFEHLLPQFLPLFRAVFLKAKYQFEELPPRFYVECARCVSPRTELLVCERNDGCIAGVMLSFYNDQEQQNKRIGLNYELADTGLIYNLLNYTGIQRAIEHGLGTLWLGQSSYVVKTRLGGELEDQYLMLKAYDVALKPTVPLQRWWMSRYSAANIQAGVEKGISI